MFYTNDPASDYDSYCEYLENKRKEWHEENDLIIEEKIDMLKCLILDIKRSDTKETLAEIFYDYDRYFEYSYDDDDTLEEIKESEIENLQSEIKKLEEELEK